MAILLLNILMASTGFAILSYGIFSAVKEANPYWYSHFVIGSFLLFDRLDMLLNNDSNLNRLFSKKWRTPVFTYLTYVACALIIDYILGRFLSNMWVYPHFDRLDEIIHVIIIGYPLGLWSCSAIFRVLNTVFHRLTSCHSSTSLFDQKYTRKLSLVLLLCSILSVLIPIANFALFNNSWVQELMVICVVIGMFSLSPVTPLLNLPSFLGRILNRDWHTIAALLVTIAVAALTNEIPNTYAWEWRYQNVPFTDFEIWDVNILVLTVGWSYLTILGISTNDLFFSVEDQRST